MTIKRFGDATMIADMVVHGGIAYLAGQVAEDPVSPSVYEQTKNILKQIDDLLAQANSDKTRILQDQHLALRHLDLRGDEQGLGRMGPEGPGAGPRDRRSEARRPAMEGRNHGDGRLQVGRLGAVGRPSPGAQQTP